jgi:hypothetical protein
VVQLAAVAALVATLSATARAIASTTFVARVVLGYLFFML